MPLPWVAAIIIVLAGVIMWLQDMNGRLKEIESRGSPQASAQATAISVLQRDVGYIDGRLDRLENWQRGLSK